MTTLDLIASLKRNSSFRCETTSENSIFSKSKAANNSVTNRTSEEETGNERQKQNPTSRVAQVYPETPGITEQKNLREPLKADFHNSGIGRGNLLFDLLHPQDEKDRNEWRAS
ncbi:hypothetical protein RUM43_003165 [Polyplax serrata]|uniref:Uncharacterized protein n=1 Tax=Polyplax serrata TaxID=468196 RepID=A0AAN8RWU5_POLSC